MPRFYGQEEPQQQEGQVDVLPKDEGRRRPKFHLLVRPQQFKWDHEAKSYFIDLMKLPIIPGCNSVGDKGDCSLAIAHHAGKGRMTIQSGDARLKMKGDEHPLLAKGQFRCRWVAYTSTQGQGVVVYGWVWEHYEKVLGDVVWHHDIEAKRRFQQHLVDAGVVEPLNNSVRRAMLRTAEARVRKLEAKDTSNLAIARRLAYAQETLKDLYADLEKHGGNVKNRLVYGESEEDAPVVKTTDGEELVIAGDAS